MATDVAHRTSVLSLKKGKAFVGLCSCKWVSPDYTTLNDARDAANEHLVAALRK